MAHETKGATMGDRLQLAIQQIEFARDYTQSLLADIDDREYFVCPPDCPTHVGWQVGHLAMAQYGLTLLRIRGREPEDNEFISKDFLRLFKKQSTPVPNAEAYPPAAEIREVLANVHHHSIAALGTYDEADLEESLPEPYAVFANKLGSILFCPAHELMHAGQIGLIRRLLGKSPIR
ncbi:MAG: DinB family protein [Planctomycetota bacterium]